MQRRPRARRPGDAAAQPPRLLDPRPLPGVRPCRAVQVLRPGPDLSPRARRRCCATTAATSEAAGRSARSAASGQVRYQGLGTEKLQAEIEEKFPGYVVRAHGQRHHAAARQPRASVLDAFRRGEIHILLGTQMIAKGLDFPERDAGRRRQRRRRPAPPDFRAAERTFQLLAQVAGRTGPRAARRPGAGADVHARASEHRPGGDPRLPEVRRRGAAASPAAQLSALPAAGHGSSSAARRWKPRADFADRLAGAFRVELERQRCRAREHSMLRLLGPAEAEVFRLKGYYRYHFQLQVGQLGVFASGFAAGSTRGEAAPGRGVDGGYRPARHVVNQDSRAWQIFVARSFAPS